MRLPRWLVISLLSVCLLAVLTAIGSWWVTWPERTARLFMNLMDTRRFDEANRMIRVDPQDDNLNFATYYYDNDWDEIESQPRSAADILFARSRFAINSRSIRFNVVRGKVIAEGYISWDETGYQFSSD